MTKNRGYGCIAFSLNINNYIEKFNIYLIKRRVFFNYQISLTNTISQNSQNSQSALNQIITDFF